jgi:hypothetical protein
MLFADGGDTREVSMRVGGSFANAAGGSSVPPNDRLKAESLSAINRKIVERLRATDEELRSKIRKEAFSRSGAPHFVDVRGPDLGLYTVDGMVIGGYAGNKGQGSAQSTPPQAVPENGADVTLRETGKVAPVVREPASVPVAVKAVATPRATAAYAPVKAGQAVSAGAVGVSKDLKV